MSAEPRWLARAGRPIEERVTAAEFDLDAHDVMFQRLIDADDERKAESKRTNRLLVGLLVSTTSGAIMFALSVLQGR